MPGPDRHPSIEHTCSEVIDLVYASRPDLKDAPIENTDDSWFTDGNSFMEKGIRKAGFMEIRLRICHTYFTAKQKIIVNKGLRSALEKQSIRERSRGTVVKSCFSSLNRRHLSWIQWASLLILFLSIVALTAGTETSQHNLAGHGFHHDAFFSPSNACLLFRSECPRKGHCTAKAWTFPEAKWNTTTVVFSHIHLGLGHVLIIVQCFISSMANIYNEKILKEGNQLAESIFIQNSKLYFFGILFNGLTLGLQSSNRDQIKNCGVFYGHNVFSVALIFVTAFQGLSVAFILKFLDNMFHVLMAQVTTVIITTVSVLVFDFRPSLQFFLEAPSVLLSIFIYKASKPPGLEFAPRQERVRDLSGSLWERSSGDGEELERLTKPKSDIESDEDTF
ncbi:probable UDP-sugar transporter protein SLC35A5 [Leptonychotes weddellii]|uniref:Probable UDP-sugar transporter protein SLC35A5 n=1 Tax=Leptonychotes weddellii TaxID=9713 RepID=A0A2U3YEC6_LEPWE|nr:probable UDP-sugar transporter protein SLC35A5 [Leptonychotes weddellii]